jgi:hypothetical protein
LSLNLTTPLLNSPSPSAGTSQTAVPVKIIKRFAVSLVTGEGNVCTPFSIPTSSVLLSVTWPVFAVFRSEKKSVLCI